MFWIRQDRGMGLPQELLSALKDLTKKSQCRQPMIKTKKITMAREIKGGE
jgi:hypothetical protein